MESMMEGMMERQAPLKLKVPKSVAVIGTGGVGSWVAYFLALAGVKELWLFDNDTISEHNLNRIPLPIATVGQRKTDALAAMLATLRPECSILAMGGFSEDVAKASTLASSINWIIAATDTLASRQMVHKWAAKQGIRYIEAAAEGEYGSCTGEPAEWSTPQEAKPGYASVPVWVGPCVFAAGVAVAHILHNTNIGDRAIRLGWEKETDAFGEKHEQFSMYDSKIQEEEVAEVAEEAQNV